MPENYHSDFHDAPLIKPTSFPLMPCHSLYIKAGVDGSARRKSVAAPRPLAASSTKQALTPFSVPCPTWQRQTVTSNDNPIKWRMVGLARRAFFFFLCTVKTAPTGRKQPEGAHSLNHITNTKAPMSQATQRWRAHVVLCLSHQLITCVMCYVMSSHQPTS